MLRRRLRLVLRLAVCVGLGLAGSAVAVAAAGPTQGQTVLGTASADLRPSFGRGLVDAYVPLVDWGIRSRRYPAPVDLYLEVRGLDRDSVVGALRSGESAERQLRQVSADTRAIVQREVWSSVGWALVGGAVGGLLGGAVLAAFDRRRWLGFGAATGLAAAALAAAGTAFVLDGVGDDAFHEPVFYARGSELPDLLAFSEQITQTTERYTDSYEQALAGLDTLISITQQPVEAAPIVRNAIVASDLHSNSLVLPALTNFSRGKTVFAVGDFAQLGSEREWWIVDPVARLGTRVIAVSGNHDSSALMRQLASRGVTVLTRAGRLRPDGTRDGRPVLSVDGMLVAGYDDPLTAGGSLADHDLEVKGEEFRAEAEAFVEWFTSLPVRPDIVLVHQHGLAHALLDSLEPGDAPLLILTGHDHVQHIEQRGPHVLVDGGTVGAGGPFGIGQQDAGFAQLHFAADGSLRAVDLVEIEPVSGAGSARRVPIDPEEESDEVVPLAEPSR
jgi:Calcineurin-like phosphoesterase superfamily domain